MHHRSLYNASNDGYLFDLLDTEPTLEQNAFEDVLPEVSEAPSDATPLAVNEETGEPTDAAAIEAETKDDTIDSAPPIVAESTPTIEPSPAEYVEEATPSSNTPSIESSSNNIAISSATTNLQPQPNEPSSSSSNAPLIGAVLGGILAALAIILLLSFFVVRRSRNIKGANDATVDDHNSAEDEEDSEMGEISLPPSDVIVSSRYDGVTSPISSTMTSETDVTPIISNATTTLHPSTAFSLSYLAEQTVDEECDDEESYYR